MKLTKLRKLFPIYTHKKNQGLAIEVSGKAR